MTTTTTTTTKRLKGMKMLTLKLQRPQNSCMQRNQDCWPSSVTECNHCMKTQTRTHVHTHYSIGARVRLHTGENTKTLWPVCSLVYVPVYRKTRARIGIFSRTKHRSLAHFRFVAVCLKNGRAHRRCVRFVRAPCSCSVVDARVEENRGFFDTFRRRGPDWTALIERNAALVKGKIIDAVGFVEFHGNVFNNFFISLVSI